MDTPRVQTRHWSEWPGRRSGRAPFVPEYSRRPWRAAPRRVHSIRIGVNT